MKEYFCKRCGKAGFENYGAYMVHHRYCRGVDGLIASLKAPTSGTSLQVATSRDINNPTSNYEYSCSTCNQLRGEVEVLKRTLCNHIEHLRQNQFFNLNWGSIAIGIGIGLVLATLLLKEAKGELGGKMLEAGAIGLTRRLVNRIL